jgi:hypothetical protein
VNDAETAVAYLRSPLAVRARCENIVEAGFTDRLAHFAIDLHAMPSVVDEVVTVTRAEYPGLAIPVHGRMSHFRAGGVDRVAALDAKLAALPPDERTRAWVDLIVVSVLLDAGAADAWRFREGERALGRSEGLAVASLHAFEAGLFSSDPLHPLRVDATALRDLRPSALAAAFQVSATNPLAGIDGRIGVVHALGDALHASPAIFPGGRPGGLVDHLHATALRGEVPASELLRALLVGLAPIGPGGETLGGHHLGDVWRHPAAGGTGPSTGFVPLHTASQWLAYSLFEPLARAGLTITQPGALTGLAEVRNGGLLVDLGVLVPKRPEVRGNVHAPGDEVIVEWRALTIALLDRVAEGVRDRLGTSPAELPLASILEGTSAAGRAVAARLREDGCSPIQIQSDGAVPGW